MCAMTRHEMALTAIPGAGEESAPEQLQTTCANPKCSKLFTRSQGPGRPATFCGDECRRETQREHRKLRRRLKHLEGQVEQLRLLLASYERSAEEPIE